MKEASRKSKLLVGAFTLGTVGVVAAVIMALGDDFSLLREESTYVAHFNDAGGLGVGAPVRVGGVDVGRVEEIGLDMEGEGGEPRVRATLVVRDPYDDLVRAGSQVKLDTQGVLGDKFLILAPGPKEGAPLAEGGEIEANETNVLSQVVDKSGDIVANVNEVTARVRTFAEGLPDPATLSNVARNIEVSTREVTEVLQALNSRDSALRTVASPATKAQIDAALRNLVAATGRLESVARKIDEGQGTLGALVNDQSLYDDMKTLLGRANRNRTVKFLIERTLATTDEEAVGGTPGAKDAPGLPRAGATPTKVTP